MRPGRPARRRQRLAREDRDHRRERDRLQGGVQTLRPAVLRERARQVGAEPAAAERADARHRMAREAGRPTGVEALGAREQALAPLRVAGGRGRVVSVGVVAGVVVGVVCRASVGVVPCAANPRNASSGPICASVTPRFGICVPYSSTRLLGDRVAGGDHLVGLEDEPLHPRRVRAGPRDPAGQARRACLRRSCGIPGRAGRRPPSRPRRLRRRSCRACRRGSAPATAATRGRARPAPASRLSGVPRSLPKPRCAEASPCPRRRPDQFLSTGARDGAPVDSALSCLHIPKRTRPQPTQNTSRPTNPSA